MFFEVAEHVFLDTIKILPFLWVIYMVIEILESRLSHLMKRQEMFFKKTGPLFGGVAGLIPQCGVSVMASNLFARRMITVGTLLSVYLVTSDEALPILLAQPEKIGVILPLLGVKLALALSVGYVVDWCWQRDLVAQRHDHDHKGEPSFQHGCCGHACEPKQRGFLQYVVHPLFHALKIFVFIFAFSLLIEWAIHQLGNDALGDLMGTHTLWQPFVSALVGLIPTCASSVAIAQLYIAGGLSFGSLAAGLCTNAGLGLLVLFKENKPLKENLALLAVLYGVSALAGLLLTVFL